MAGGGPQLPPGVDPWTTPAGKPPPGVIPNLVNPDRNKNIGTVTLSVFIALTTLFVLLRFYVRFRINHSPWWDDLAVGIALPAQIAFSGVTIWMCEAGLVGQHIWDTPIAIPLMKLPYWTVVIAVLPQAIAFFVKLSILLLYYRIFSPNRWVRYGIYFGIVVCFCMYTTWFFVFLFQKVLNDRTGAYLSWAQAAFNVGSDFYILVLPLYAVSKLHLNKRKKAGILAIFATGIAACAMSILTLYYRTQYSGSSDPDPTWNATARVTVSCLELDIGLMCACMPLFAQLVSKNATLGGWFTSLRSTVRSRLLRTQSSRGTGSGSRSGASRSGGGASGYGNGSPNASQVHKSTTYSIEMGSRKPSTTGSEDSRPVRGGDMA